MDDLLYTMHTSSSTWEVLSKLGYSEVLHEYSKLRDQYIPKTPKVDPHELAKMRRYLRNNAPEELRKIIRELPPDKVIELKFHILGLKLQNIIAEYKLLKELKERDVPGDVFLWNPKYHETLVRYLRYVNLLETVDALISGDFDKKYTEKLIEKLKKMGVSNSELHIILTPLKSYAPLELAAMYVQGKDLIKNFFGSKILYNRFLKKYENVIRNITRAEVENLKLKRAELLTAKRQLAEKCGNIIWEIERLLQFDNFYGVEAGRLAFVELEHIPIRLELYKYIFGTEPPSLFKAMLELDKILEKKKTFGDHYLFQPVPIKYAQRYICIAAAPINAVAVWSKKLREMSESERIELEKQTYLNASMYGVLGEPYLNALVDYSVNFLANKFGIDDVVSVIQPKPEWSWAIDPNFWTQENIDKIYEMFKRYGLRPRLLKYVYGRELNSTKTELTKEFISKYIEFNRKAIELHKNFKNIRSKITPELVKRLLREGYSIAIHHPVYGATQHVVVLYGYSDKKKAVYIYDQLGSMYSVNYDRLTDFTEMPAGWAMWGFRKNINAISYMKKVTEVGENLINKIYTFIQS